MHKNERLDNHQKFKEMSALSQGDMLSSQERGELERHIQYCDSCRQIYDEFSLISDEGMPVLAAHYGLVPEHVDWDNRAARQQLLLRIRAAEQRRSQLVKSNGTAWRFGFRSGDVARYRGAAVGLAACLMVAVAAGAYHMGGRIRENAALSPGMAAAPLQQLASGKRADQQLLDAQGAQISHLQTQVSVELEELVRLRAASRAAEENAIALTAANSRNQQQLRLIGEQRDKLAAQLHEAEQAYQSVQLELASLRAEHDRVLVRTTSLESRLEDLTAAAREQERKLNDDAQYLASDRDIRELMGARKLYIADVFDVDSRSRTRKPFGRVFYTQNKSLIFYAFDLDHEPGVKSASAFQVWGQRDNDPGEKAHPMNLGILYLDNEQNRRWVLRFDDPKQLAEIDAVFVTVEPRGGSQKPSGKPLLYALLRKEANHP